MLESIKYNYAYIKSSSISYSDFRFGKIGFDVTFSTVLEYLYLLCVLYV